jgi:hypothetical protein
MNTPRLLAASLVLAACSVPSFAQTHHKAPVIHDRGKVVAAQPDANSDSNSSYGDERRGLHEDLNGSVVSTSEATQLCQTLSQHNRREDCIANVSRDDTSTMPMDGDNRTGYGSPRR